MKLLELELLLDLERIPELPLQLLCTAEGRPLMMMLMVIMVLVLLRLLRLLLLMHTARFTIWLLSRRQLFEDHKLSTIGSDHHFVLSVPIRVHGVGGQNAVMVRALCKVCPSTESMLVDITKTNINIYAVN